MVTASVTVVFEAANSAEVQAQVSTWKLHEGCQVYIQVTEAPAAPMEADSTGKLSKVEEKPTPPPPTPLPPDEGTGEAKSESEPPPEEKSG